MEYSRFAADSQVAHAEMYAHDILGNFNAGMNAYLDWNIYLDEQGGPNHVKNYCDAPVMCDTKMIRSMLNYLTIISDISAVLSNAEQRGC